MTTPSESGRGLACSREVQCLLDLIESCGQITSQQANGQVSLEPESVSLALDLAVAAVERIRIVLTQARPPEPPPEPPEPEPVEATAQGTAPGEESPPEPPRDPRPEPRPVVWGM